MQTEAKPKRAASLQSLVNVVAGGFGLEQRVIDEGCDVRVNRLDGGAGGDAGGAGVHYAARFAGAFFRAILIAAGADAIIALDAGERRGAGGAEIAENFLGDYADQAF